MRLYKHLKENHILPDRDLIIMDLGCGDGRVLQPFHDDGYVVMGIDTDATEIDIARTSMKNGTFVVGDVRNVTAPEKSFVIVRNVFPFFESKDEVSAFLKKHEINKGYFTLFGINDEKSETALTWTKEEVEVISEANGAKIVEEFDGMGTNLSGQPRRSHVFHLIKK